MRERVWPFKRLWGTPKKERVAIKNYLRIVWEEHNDHGEAGSNYDEDDVEEERDMILNVSRLD